MEKKRYDSTVARIAGNIMSGTFDDLSLYSIGANEGVDANVSGIVQGAVKIARAIVAETERTEPEPR